MFILFLKYCYLWASKFFFRASKNLKVMILLAQRVSKKEVSVEPWLQIIMKFLLQVAFTLEEYCESFRPQNLSV